MLRHGYCYGDATLFNEIKAVPGNQEVTVRQGHWEAVSQDKIAPVLTPTAYEHADQEELEGEAIRVFMAGVERLYERTKGAGPIVLPLSGGLDSRALLCGLLEVVGSASEIRTYVYGEPGARDVELSRRVAKRAGVAHQLVDMTPVTFDVAGMRAAARAYGANTTLFSPYLVLQAHAQFDPETSYWSGYFADLFAGARATLHQSTSMSQALLRFKHARARPHELWKVLRAPNASWEQVVSPGTGHFYQDATYYDEQVFIANHVERFTNCHNFKQGTRYVCPFLEEDFIAFWLSIPYTWRLGKRLYRSSLYKRWPRIFDIETTSGHVTEDPTLVDQVRVKTTEISRKILWRATRGRVKHPGGIVRARLLLGSPSPAP